MGAPVGIGLLLLLPFLLRRRRGLRFRIRRGDKGFLGNGVDGADDGGGGTDRVEDMLLPTIERERERGRMEGSKEERQTS